MRKVKFRAWSEYSNKLVVWEHMKVDDSLGSVLNGDDKKIHVMQFTGLKDKNAREIYEGDIWYDGHFPRVIKYDEEYAGFLPFVTDGGCGCCSEGGTGYRESDGEIIGNIYENPELLDGENL